MPYNGPQTCSVRIITIKHTMKEELKQKMISVIGTHSNALIESIAEKCAQVAIDYYKERYQSLSMSGVSCSLPLPKCKCDQNALPYKAQIEIDKCSRCGNDC